MSPKPNMTSRPGGSPSKREAARARRRKADRQRRLVMAGGALLVAALAALAVVSSGSGDSAGSTAAEGWDLPQLNGEGRVQLADFRGEPLVVNFFASWCTACDAELPGFRRVSEELRGQVQFVGVASLETGDPMTMPERHAITWWPLARDVGGREGSGLHDTLGGRGMPITAFYNADGNLIDFVGGGVPESFLRYKLRALYGVEV